MADTDVTWITYSLRTLLIPSFIAAFIYFIAWPPAATLNKTVRPNKHKKMTTRKPKDGTVKVSRILIHPIKSCRGTSVQSAKYTTEGLEHDRKFAIMDATTRAILTVRQIPKMVLINPKISGEDLIISFPSGSGCKSFNVPLNPSAEALAKWELIEKLTLFEHSLDGYIVQSTSPDLPASTPSDILSAYFGKPVHLIYKGPVPRAVDATYEFPELNATSVYQDMYPLLLLSEEGMVDIERETRSRIGEQGIEEKWAEETIELRRFRPNIVFKGAGAWAEDDWEEVKFGSLEAPKITLVSKCARCLLPNVSPETGERDKAVPYKVISKFRTNKDPLQKLTPCVGSNATVEAPGIVNVGDVVYVTKLLGEGLARVYVGEQEEKKEVMEENTVGVAAAT